MKDAGEIRVCLGPEDVTAIQAGKVVDKFGASPGTPPDTTATVRLVGADSVIGAVVSDTGSKRLFHTVEESATCIAVHCNGGHKLRWATLDLVEWLPREQVYERRTLPWPPPGDGFDPDVYDTDWDECTTCHQARWAGHTSACVRQHERYVWIVRRFDWFDPTPERDPSFNQAVTPGELRELLGILDGLNNAVKERDWAAILAEKEPS